VAGAIGGLHQMLAVAMRSPEMELSKAEAKAITESGLNVARWYLPLTGKPSKVNDLFAFGGTLALIYIPRFRAARKRQAPPVVN
jgi:hypothetical protein